MANIALSLNVVPRASGVRRYPGVHPFNDDEIHRQLFRGRDAEKYELLQLVLVERLVLLFGRSGLGKSSLINAGLLELLRSKGFFPMVVRISGSDQGPFKSLYDGIKTVADQGRAYQQIEYEPSEPEWNTTSLWHFFKTFELWRDDKLLSPVLIIDQFEELFTLQSADQRKQFIHEIADLVRGTRPKEALEQHESDAPKLMDRPPDVKVVLALREEFLANLEELADRIPAILKARFRLSPLSREQAKRAIVEPAEAELEEQAVSTPRFKWSGEALACVLDFLCEHQSGNSKTEMGDEVEPFQLQLVCQYIEDLVQEKNLETVTAEDLGGKDTLERIITNFYEDAINKICSKVRGKWDLAVQRWTSPIRLRRRLEWLCEYGLITARGQRLLREESTIMESDNVPPEILAEMVEIHLLRKEPRRGVNYYELTHDALIEPIRLSRERRERKRRNRWRILGSALVGVVVLLCVLLWQKIELITAEEEIAESKLFLEQDPSTAARILQDVKNPEKLANWIPTVEEVLRWPIAYAVLKGHTNQINSASFNPDSTLLVTASHDHTALLWKADGDRKADNDRKLATLQGHSGPVWSAAFNPAGTQVVTASEDGTARLWEVPSGTLLTTLQGHSGPVLSAAFNPAGTQVVTASEDGTARLWEVPSGTLLTTLQGHSDPVLSAAFNPAGTQVVTASEDGTARLWEVPSGTLLATLQGHSGPVLSAAFSPDGSRVVTASEDQTAWVWKADSSGQILAKLPTQLDIGEKQKRTISTMEFIEHKLKDYFTTHKDYPKSLSDILQDNALRRDAWDKEFLFYSNKNTYVIASLGEDGEQEEDWQRCLENDCSSDLKTTQHFGADIVLVKETWRQPSGLQQYRGEGVLSAFFIDSRSVMMALSDGRMRMSFLPEDANSLEASKELHFQDFAEHKAPVVITAFSQYTNMLLTASKDAQTQFGRLLKRSDMLKGHGSWVTAASFSPYGTRMVTASSDGEVRLWRTRFGLTEEEVYAAAFSPDGRRLALTSTDGRVRLWDAETGQAGGIGHGHTAAVWSVAFSPDGRRLASASDDQTVRRWDAETGQPIGEPLKGHTAAVQSVAFSPDGRHLASASTDGEVRLWDAETGQLIGEPLKGHTAAVQSVAFSPNGRRLASASTDGEIRLWETRDDSRTGLKALAVLETCQEQQPGQPAAVQSVAFSPNGRRLASAGGAGRGEVCLWKWDVEMGQPIGKPLKGHTATVQSVAFSPDGRRLASASTDGEIRLWDAETGEVRGAGRGHMEAVQSVAFSPKGRRLASASADGEIRLWETRDDSRAGLKALKAIAVLKTHQGQQPGQPLVSYLKARLSTATTGCPDPNEGPEWPDKKSDEEGKEFSKACTGSIHKKSLSAR